LFILEKSKIIPSPSALPVKFVPPLLAVKGIFLSLEYFIISIKSSSLSNNIMPNGITL